MAGCTASTASTPCVERTSAAIYGADDDAGTPGETDALSLAIGQLSDRGRPLCTATRIAHGWALTAAHCVTSGADLWFASAGIAHGVLGVITHATLDVALVSWTESPARGAGLPLAPSTVSSLQVGDEVVLAGRGLTAHNTLGALRTVTERVARVEPAKLVVDGAGRSGACNGDSGGPLLMRNDEGRFELLGVLARGSASCAGLDEYVPATAFIDWAQALVPALELAQPADCGASAASPD